MPMEEAEGKPDETVIGNPIGVSIGRDDFLVNMAGGADRGAGSVVVKPTVLISSGWNKPRREGFLIYLQRT